MYTVMKFMMYWPILKHTHISQATWPVNSPIYLFIVHFTYYIYDTGVHAVVPSSTLAPCSCPGLSASSHSKHLLTARKQVAAPSLTSLGPIPQDRKQHLSPVPNKQYKQQPPSQPTNLTSSTTSWIYNIFPSGHF